LEEDICNIITCYQICWRSVQGFSVVWGLHFAIPHWHWRSSL